MTYQRRADADGWLHDERRALERDSRDIVPREPPAQREAQRWATGETVADYGKRWIAERTLKPRTRALYETQLSQFIEPDLGTVPVRSLTPERVRRWYASLDGTYARRNSQCYALLSAIMATAVKDGVLAASPCRVERAMSAQRKREPVILTVPELAKLADAIGDQYRAFVLLSAWCGLRWGEVTELRRRDIGAGCEVITVARAVTHPARSCHIDTPKSGKPRTVVVPPHIRSVVKHHLDSYVGKGDDRAPVRSCQGWVPSQGQDLRGVVLQASADRDRS